MNDVTQHYRFQRILIEAAQYRTLRELFRADPTIKPPTADLFRRCFLAERDDASALRRIAEGQS